MNPQEKDPRIAKIREMMGEGLSNKEIAQELGLSLSTVNNLISAHIYLDEDNNEGKGSDKRKKFVAKYHKKK